MARQAALEGPLMADHKATYGLTWGPGCEKDGLTLYEAHGEVKALIARGTKPIKVFNLDRTDLDFDGLTDDERDELADVMEQDWVECCACCALYARKDGRGQACVDCTAKAEPRNREDR
jgi:hypothetical protein